MNSTLPIADCQLQIETMPLVVVQYLALQEGYAQLPPLALFNVVGGEVAGLIGSTVDLQSLIAKGYHIEERRAA